MPLALPPAADPAPTPLEQIVVLAPRRVRAGPGLSATGGASYALTRATIAASPQGAATPLSTLLTQLPGVSADQNQQIHIRDTEGPQFQYDIDGMLVPFDINTNPPFLSMLNARFIDQLTLLTGILPARYSYATGGVVDLAARDGCADPGGDAALTLGSRRTFAPALDEAGCWGPLAWQVSASTTQSDTGFSSATPGPDPIHDRTRQGAFLAHVTDRLGPATTLDLLFSGNSSTNQLPDVPGLTPSYALATGQPEPSGAIASMLDLRDTLGMAVVKFAPDPDTQFSIGYAGHAIAENFLPDRLGELAYQGVASHATHQDQDHTLQADFSRRLGAHILTLGAYLGLYRVTAADSSQVFPLTPSGAQASTTPITLTSLARASNFLAGLYGNDLWTLSPALTLNLGLRLDDLTGFSHGIALDPTANLAWHATRALTLHLGAMRAFQVPNFQGISPDAIAQFANTTASGPPGAITPRPEHDTLFDAGLLWHLTPHFTLSEDSYYEITRNYLDTGQFGVVPIFAPFNYRRGTLWGSDTGLRYAAGPLSLTASLTLARNVQRGIGTGQFNFDPAELAFIDAHGLVLDHAPLLGGAFGAGWNRGPFAASLTNTYSSGLRAGFADRLHLPATFQTDLSFSARFHPAGLPAFTNRVTFLNLFDRTNLIRPADGIGIFQSAYGPRRTLLDTISVPFG